MLTHDELVAVTAKWLKNHTQNAIIPNCTTICTEIVTANCTGETPDVLGWCYWTSVLIEVKVSRADFLKDKKKPFRQFSSLGLGEFRYYCCPEMIISEAELPDKWGLIYCNDKGKLFIVKKAERLEANLIGERTMLLSLIRRENN